MYWDTKDGMKINCLKLETNQFSRVPPCSATLALDKLENTDLILGVQGGMSPGPRQFAEI